jgi:hypothetical protein
MSDSNETNLPESPVLEPHEHDWYDPEIVWQSTYSPDSVRISNYALRFVCKNCLIEVIGVTGSPALMEKLTKQDCNG